MALEIIDCEQGSNEWFQARLGVPTASNFSSILAKGEGKTRRKYLLKLAGEIITGELQEAYTNGAMERGKIMEEEARNLYALLTDANLQKVGFIKNGNKGCSPDALIGDDGILEIKTAQPDILINILDADKFPSEHIAQCQGNLWVAERESLDLFIYWPKLPPFKKRVFRDEEYIKNLSCEVDRFNEDLLILVDKVKNYGGFYASH